MGVGSVGPVLHSSKAALLVSTTQDFQIFSPVLLKPHIVVGPFFFTSDAVFQIFTQSVPHRLVCSAGVNTPSFYISVLCILAPPVTLRFALTQQ